MRMILIATALLITPTLSHAQYYEQHEYRYQPYPPYEQPYYPPQEPYYEQPNYRSSDLTRKCALASEYLKQGKCGPEGCDKALCIALQHGCRINTWGYRCPQYEGR